MTASITPTDLAPEELLLARATFDTVSGDYLRAEHQLRQVLSKMGLFAPDDQVQVFMDHFENKVSFSDFCRLLCFMKGVHRQPEPRDADTLRAFVALGGSQDRTGTVNAEYLRFACKRFDLTIDIDKLIREVDTSRNGTIDYDEFQQLWKMGKAHGISQIVKDDDPASRSFWEDAVRNAHLAASEIEEELNALKGNEGGASAALGSSVTGGVGGATGGSSNNLLRDKDDTSSSQADLSVNNKNNKQQQQNNNKDGDLSLQEAVGRIHLGVVLAKDSDEDGGVIVEEMPKADQLRNYLETGNTAGIVQQNDFYFGGGGVEHGRRKSNFNANSSSIAALGFNSNINASASHSNLLLMNNGGAGDKSTRRLGNNMSNNNVLQQSAIGGGGGNAASASQIRGGSKNDAAAHNQSHMMLNRSVLPTSSTGHLLLRTGNNAGNQQAQLLASDLVPNPNASPAEILKAARDMLKFKIEHIDHKKEDEEIEKKMNQMASARPMVVGGISISERRGEGIDLPEPLTVGSGPTSGRQYAANNGGGNNTVISPTRSSTTSARFGTTTNSTVVTSGRRAGGARGWR
jgi:Ca2+-binding EF-hand superfamily protein